MGWRGAIAPGRRGINMPIRPFASYCRPTFQLWTAPPGSAFDFSAKKPFSPQKDSCRNVPWTVPPGRILSCLNDRTAFRMKLRGLMTQGTYKAPPGNSKKLKTTRPKNFKKTRSERFARPRRDDRYFSGNLAARQATVFFLSGQQNIAQSQVVHRSWP